MRVSVVLVSIVSGLAAAAPQAADSQASGASVRLTPAEAVQKALATSPRLRQAQAQERGAQADVRAARAGALPQVDLSGGYTRMSDVPEVILSTPGAPPRVLFPNIPDNYRAHAGLGLALYTGGRLAALREAAKGESTAAGRDVESDRQDVILETRTAYWSLVTAREMAGVVKQAQAAYDAHLKDAENRERMGLAARNEVLAVRVERERSELTRLRAENAAAVAEANLARLTGVAAGTAIETADALEDGSAAPAGIETLVEAALAARSERAALLARVEAAEARVRLERAARLPQVSLGAAYDYANPNRNIVPPEAVWRDTWSVGVTAGLALFDGGKAAAGAARARARVDALRAQLDDVTQRIRLQVTQRVLDVEAARAGVEVADRSLEWARENQRVASDRYRAGVIVSSELLDAEVALLRAGLDRAESLTELRMAGAALDRATGR